MEFHLWCENIFYLRWIDSGYSCRNDTYIDDICASCYTMNGAKGTCMPTQGQQKMIGNGTKRIVQYIGNIDVVFHGRNDVLIMLFCTYPGLGLIYCLFRFIGNSKVYTHRDFGYSVSPDYREGYHLYARAEWIEPGRESVHAWSSRDNNKNKSCTGSQISDQLSSIFHLLCCVSSALNVTTVQDASVPNVVGTA